MKKLVLFLIFISIALLGFCQTETTVEEIINNPGKFNHERVFIEGFVSRYVVGSATTSSYYELQGDYGGRIRINTAEPAPTINARYSVAGSVTIHMQEPLIIEIRKARLPDDIVDDDIVDDVSVNDEKSFIDFIKDNLLLIIIALSLVIIIILILYNLLPGKKSSSSIDQKSGNKNTPEVKDKNDQKQYDTIRFKTDKPKTVHAIPGKLEILVGADQGKSLKLVGTDTSDGVVATIGRYYDGWEDDLSGDKKFAHICINDESRTLSRMQAEIIYKHKQVFLKNLGGVNPSRINGSELQVNESALLEEGSVITAGFMEFRYKT